MQTNVMLFYPEVTFGGFTHVDGTVNFYSRVNALLRPDAVVVDVGCGRGRYALDPVPFRRNLRILRGKCKTVIGIDVDKCGTTNQCVDEFRLISHEVWPIEDESIDLCVSDSVLEHLPDPVVLFSESRRVLKPHGFLCIRTPNTWGYGALVARLVPNRWHAAVLQIVSRGQSEEQDIFPTLYRCNTVRKLKRMSARFRFRLAAYTYEAEPGYLNFSKLAYRLGRIYQRHALPAMRSALFAFAEKLP